MSTYLYRGHTIETHQANTHEFYIDSKYMGEAKDQVGGVVAAKFLIDEFIVKEQNAKLEIIIPLEDFGNKEERESLSHNQKIP